MECNKQEAIRAKEIAETKMQSKDYRGAHKFALRAQTLYPELDNISQIVTVCEVHCSSEKYIFGNEKDWYSILKIEHTADETSIKKQYRKLALLLHPDKNNFAGATDAFKLIGEAQRVLLDSEKRKSHDFKHRATRSFAPVRPQHHQAYKNSNSAAASSTWQPGNTRVNTNGHFSSFNPQTASSSIKETFWTSCPFCGIRYQYYKDLVNRLLQCQECKKSFTAYEVKGGANLNPMSDFLKKEKTSNRKSGGGVYSTVKLKKNDVSQNGTTSGQTKGGKDKRTVRSPKASNIKEDKAGKMKTESSGTTESESSDDSDEMLEGDLDADDLSKQNGEVDPSLRRRSTRTRSKRNVSYQENMSDDDVYEESLKKKMKSGGQQQPQQDSINLSSEDDTQQANKADDSEEDASQTVMEDDGKASSDTVKEDDGKAPSDTVKEDDEKAPSDTSLDDPLVYTCADPEFNDFESIRKEDCFEIGQVWACYDDVDAMPRFYCRIAKVISPGFKLRIMWLEPDPFEDEDPNKWEEDEFPVSCGIFKRGKYEFTEEIFMFSHLVHIEKGIRKDRFKVYPRKGETWALFKNCVPNATVGNKYEYEFVEVLSDYNQESGISVGPLAKVKGFTCLYNRTTTNEELDSFQVVPSKLYRFSHMVPSFKMSGTEREGVPAGSFELDPASLSTNDDNPKDDEDSSS